MMAAAWAAAGVPPPTPPMPLPLVLSATNGTTTPSQQDEGLVELSALDVALCVALVVVQLAASWRLRLGLHNQLAVAAFRCVAQLSLLGLVLRPIFELGAERWYVVVGYGTFMVTVAAFEASGRPSYAYPGLFADVALVLAFAAVATISYAAFVVLRLQPWYTPKYILPIFGMVLGNTITGVSVGLNAALEELATSKDRLERLLALGASRDEATRGCVARAVKVSMMPTLNGMHAVGLISIPGMMSGQILGGSDAGTAARYQIFVFFHIAMASTITAYFSVNLAVAAVVDASARYRADKLVRRDKGKKGSGGWRAWAPGVLWQAAAGRIRRRASRGGDASTGAREPLLGGGAGAAAATRQAR